MAKTGLKVSLSDTTLGTPKQSNGNCMLVYGIPSGTATSKPYLVTSYDEYLAYIAQTSGDGSLLTSDAHAKASVKKFFDIAGSGAKLWIVVVVANSIVEMDDAKVKTAIILSAQSDFDNRPRIVGYEIKGDESTFDTSTGYPKTSSVDFDDFVHSLASQTSDMFNDGYRYVNIVATQIDVTKSFSASGLNLGSLNEGSVAVVVTSTVSMLNSDSNEVVVPDACEAMAMCVNASLGQSIGDVSVPSKVSRAYFNDKTSNVIGTSAIEVGTYTRTQYDSIGALQAVFHRTRVQRAGRFYNDGATCNDATKALSSIEMVRVANAVCDDAEYYFQGIINTQVPCDSDGNATQTYCTNLENEFYNSYCVPRESAGEVSSISVSVNGDNFVSDRQISVSLSILPSPTCREAFVYVFYVSQTA